MSIWWSLQLQRDAASVPLARRLLAGAMDTAGVDPDVAHELSLALTEACANAVQHAGGWSEVYWVTLAIDGDVCRIEVADEGPGLPGRAPAAGAPVREIPAPVSDPDQEREDGRGLHLIEALADHVHYGSCSSGGGGTLVAFDRTLRWRADAVLLHR